MIIYKTINLINGMIYIGQDSINRSYYFGSGVLIIQSIKDFGKENFKKETIEVCGSKAELDEQEKYWIAKLNSTNPKIGYNIAKGGGGSLGYKHTAESKQRMSENHWLKNKESPRKGIKLSEDHKRKISENHGMKGKHHSKEAKLKISKRHKGKPPWNKGIHLSEDHKQKLSESKKGRMVSDEHRRNLSKNNSCYWKGKTFSPEHLQKMSESHKGKNPWNTGKKLSDEHCKKISDSLKKRKFTKEHCEKIKLKCIKRYNIPEDELYQLYIINKLSYRQISYKYGCSKKTIINKCKNII